MLNSITQKVVRPIASYAPAFSSVANQTTPTPPARWLSKKIGFIGSGHGAESIFRGLLIAKPTPIAAEDVYSYDPDDFRRGLFAGIGSQIFKSGAEVVAAADVTVLAVKPQVAGEVLRSLKGEVPPGKLLVSMMAGRSIEWMQEQIGSDSVKIIRSMPNTPTTVGYGACAIYAPESIPQEDVDLVRELFVSVGSETVEVTEEDHINVATGLSGSGPAYIFRLMEAMADGAAEEGMPRELAMKLAIRTVLGAGHLAEWSSKEPATLAAEIATKGGTTEAALKMLKRKKYEAAARAAVSRGTERARELGALVEKSKK